MIELVSSDPELNGPKAPANEDESKGDQAYELELDEVSSEPRVGVNF